LFASMSRMKPNGSFLCSSKVDDLPATFMAAHKKGERKQYHQIKVSEANPLEVVPSTSVRK
jgi:hypothetical protein